MLKSKRRRCRLIGERQPIKGAFVRVWLGEAADKWPSDSADGQLHDGRLTADFIRAPRTRAEMNLSFNWAGPGNSTEGANGSEKGWNEPGGQIGKFNAFMIFDVYVIFVCMTFVRLSPVLKAFRSKLFSAKIYTQQRSHRENFCPGVVEGENVHWSGSPTGDDSVWIAFHSSSFWEEILPFCLH